VSVRWADPRARLLEGDAWAAPADQVLTGLGLSNNADAHLYPLVSGLDAAWRQLANRLAESGDDARVRLTPAGAGGRVRLSVSRVEALDIPQSLKDLRAAVAAMLPRVDLPELLLEVHAWTGFLDEYVHVGELSAKVADLPISMATLLIADGCNVGLTPVISGHEALTHARLSRIDQNYVRAETHAAANARLVTAQAAMPIAAYWGGGHVASADGMRFVVPVRTINAAPNPKYFRRKQGLTWFNAVNDQVAGIGAMVVPDSLYILDTMLNLDIAWLSPLVRQHVNMLGRYSFTAPHGTSLRPLRDPETTEE